MTAPTTTTTTTTTCPFCSCAVPSKDGLSRHLLRCASHRALRRSRTAAADDDDDGGGSNNKKKNDYNNNGYNNGVNDPKDVLRDRSERRRRERMERRMGMERVGRVQGKMSATIG